MRKVEIAESEELKDFRICDKNLSLLRDQFDRLKHRETMGMPGTEIIDFHGEFGKKFQFKIPLNPRNLSQMIHPYQGYLSAMSKHITFPELVKVYENQVVSSVERSTGREQLGEELSCLSFWLAYTEESSIDDYSEFKGLMDAFRFAKLETIRDFKIEFGSILHKEGGHGEMTQVGDGVMTKVGDGKEEEEKSEVFRFDLARRIFLQRGL